jgi:cytochrome c oxidase cbb3-type subunit 4
MKFINYLESMTGVGIYPLTSLMIFFVFFIGVMVFVIKGKKEYFDMLSQLPLTAKQQDQHTLNNTGYDEAAQ